MTSHANEPRDHRIKIAILSAAALIALWLAPATAWAHCDAVDGPVVQDARAALTTGKLRPVLKWVRPGDERALRSAFTQVRRVRAKGDDARKLADRFFFETVVRLHRASEGEPYTGLKRAGLDPGPGVKSVDAALGKGNVDAVVDAVTKRVADGIRKRFRHALVAKRTSSKSSKAGRAYVAAYVELVHYVKRLYLAASHDAAHRPAAGGDHHAAH